MDCEFFNSGRSAEVEGIGDCLARGRLHTEGALVSVLQEDRMLSMVALVSI